MEAFQARHSAQQHYQQPQQPPLRVDTSAPPISSHQAQARQAMGALNRQQMQAVTERLQQMPQQMEEQRQALKYQADLIKLQADIARQKLYKQQQMALYQQQEVQPQRHPPIAHGRVGSSTSSSSSSLSSGSSSSSSGSRASSTSTHSQSAQRQPRQPTNNHDQTPQQTLSEQMSDRQCNDFNGTIEFPAGKWINTTTWDQHKGLLDQLIAARRKRGEPVGPPYYDPEKKTASV